MKKADTIYKRRSARPETLLQEWFAGHLRRLGVLFCASTGGERAGARQGAANKRRGYQKGCPDIWIFEPRGHYHGMAIELKYLNDPTEEQKVWKIELESRDYFALIMPNDLTFQQAQDWLEHNTAVYLSMDCYMLEEAQ